MRFPVTIKVYVGFGVLFLLSATIGIISYSTTKKQERISQTVNHTYAVMNATDDIQTLVSKMESYRRGLRSTHQKAYLDLYYQEQAKMASAISDLSKLVVKDPVQDYRVAALDKYINGIIYFWSKLRLDESRYDSTEIAAITIEEQNQVNSIGIIIKDIIKAEDIIRSQSEADNNKLIRILSWISPAGTILVQAFISILIYLVIIEFQKRKKAEQGLYQTIEKEKQLNELKSRFVSMASHEFRTPLASILASTYLAAKYKTTEQEPNRAKHYERITSAVHNLTEILEDLLSVDKLEVGKVQVNIQELNIQDQVTTLINDFQTILKPGQKITYEHNGPSNAMLDNSFIKHILTNLLSNAIKFSKEGTVIGVQSYHSGKQLMISVKDSGIGIPKSDLEHLFDRFHRGSNASNFEGTGLGLHIVYKYTKLMGGKVKCTSEEGIGTEFVLTFPQESIQALVSQKIQAVNAEN